MPTLLFPSLLGVLGFGLVTASAGNLPPATTDSLFNQVDRHFNSNHTTQGFQLLDSMLLLFSSEEEILSDVMNEYGYYCYILGDMDRSIRYYQQSLGLERALSDTATIVGRLKNIGIVYGASGQPQRALDHYLEASTLAQGLGRAQSIASVNNSVATLMYEMRQYKKARRYYRIALRVWTGLKDTLRLAYVYNNLGQVHYDEGNYDSALLFYRQSLRWKQRANRPRTLPTTFYNLGNTYLALRQPDTAEHYLMASFRAAGQHAMKRELASASNSLSQFYLANRQPIRARAYLDTVNVLLRRLSARSIRLEYLRLEAAYYETTGQPAAALAHQKQWAALRDSLFNEERLNVVEAQSAYMLQQEEQAREKAELQATLARTESQQQRRYTRAATMGGALLTVVSVVLFRLYRANRRMKERNAGLVREVHHRVKNNLHAISSLLSLQSRRLADHNAKEAMRETQLRIQSMALIHRRLYGEQMAEINMRNYLTELVPPIFSTFGTRATLQFAVDNVLLDVDQAVPVGLITNEVVSNACKHAFPDHPHPALRVCFRQTTAAACELLIQDNGPGGSIEEHSAPKTFGTKLIQLQTAQLNGKMEYVHDEGVLFRLSFPKKQRGTL